MQWFKNLHAKPKLILSFGILLAISGLIGFLAMMLLNEANTRLDELYRTHLIGLNETASIRKAKLDSGRYVRNAIVYANDPAKVAENLRMYEDLVAQIHEHVDTVGKLLVTKDGQDELSLIRSLVPEWDKLNHDVFAYAAKGDTAGATKALEDTMQISPRLDVAAQKIVDTKLEAGQQMWEESHKSTHQAAINLTLLLIGAVLIGMFLAIWIASQFSKPLAKTVKVLRKMADGDLTSHLDIETTEEVGQMAVAFNEALENMRQLLDEVTTSSTNLSSAAQQLAATAENFAAGSQEQAASLEETSASLEEITAAVRQNADNAKEANVLAASSRDAAEQGGSVVSTAVSAMSEINAASAKISDIITTIDEIAFQTNLLAVNAAVEAARAGEQGRGFAVVASEVRNLAQRSAGAAKEIKLLIQDSLRKVDRGSELVNRSGETLQGIVTSVKHVTDIVGEIAAASAEQSAGIDQVNTAMSQMDRVTQSNSSQTDELSSTAQTLSEQSTRLLSLVQRFTISEGSSTKFGQSLRPSSVGSPKRSSLSSSMPAKRSSSSSTSLRLGHRSANGNGNGNGTRTSDRALSAAAVMEATDDDFEQF